MLSPFYTPLKCVFLCALCVLCVCECVCVSECGYVNVYVMCAFVNVYSCSCALFGFCETIASQCIPPACSFGLVITYTLIDF